MTGLHTPDQRDSMSEYKIIRREWNLNKISFGRLEIPDKRTLHNADNSSSLDEFFLVFL